MALYYDLRVFQDVYKLILRIFEFTVDFPREYKYTLGQDMKRDSIVLVRNIYRANKARDKLDRFPRRPTLCCCRISPVHSFTIPFVDVDLSRKREWMI